MLSQFFEYARYLKPVMKLFIAALAAGALAAAASGFGFPLMIAKVFPVVFDNTQIPPELQDMIARLIPPNPNRTNRKRNHTASRTAARHNRPVECRSRQRRSLRIRRPGSPL